MKDGEASAPAFCPAQAGARRSSAGTVGSRPLRSSAGAYADDRFRAPASLSRPGAWLSAA
jgi:hypothetical protein